MDFTSQLQNLQRSAKAATSRDQGRDGSGGGPDRRRHPDGRRQHDPYDNRHRRNRRGGNRHRKNESLRDAIMSLPQYRPHAVPSPRDHKATATPHVALLFITIDDLPYEEVWREWASSVNEEESGVVVSVLCHAKFPDRVKSPWLRKRLLVRPPVVGRGREYEAPTFHSRCPDWGSIEITRAMIDLVRDGLDIGHSREPDQRFSTDRYSANPRETVTSVDRFIFVSETCLPVATLAELRGALFENEKKNESANDQKDAIVPEIETTSWVNARNTPNNGYSRQLQFDKVSRAIPGPRLWKADQWMMLARPHAAAIASIDRNLPRESPLWRCFQHCSASDEMYFPTALALLGLLSVNEHYPRPDAISRRRITFADWSESSKNPALYSQGIKDLERIAKIAREEGCLFARKFSPFDAQPDKHGCKQATGHISPAEWKLVIQRLTKTKAKEQLEC